ncbi:ATPase [Bacteroidota bacterium]
MMTPHIIQEANLSYELGSFNNNCIQYDFDKILIYLDAKGRMLFGQDFKIQSDDLEIIYKLCVYTVQDFEKCRKHNLDPHKGLLLSGPVGCGKTSLMKLVRYLTPHKSQYKIIPSRNVVFGFNHIGYKTIEDYGNSNFYCFDDIGVEPQGKHFGQDCNVMGEILLSRYDLYLSPKKKEKTHGTTNLNAKELEERYGNRVRSRMRQLFNLVAFDKDCFDKR